MEHVHERVAVALNRRVASFALCVVHLEAFIGRLDGVGGVISAWSATRILEPRLDHAFDVVEVVERHELATHLDVTVIGGDEVDDTEALLHPERDVLGEEPV